MKGLNKIARQLCVANKHHDPGRLLFSAVSQKKPSIVERLIREFDANINERDDSGRTPLSRAVDAGHKATVDYLLSNENIEVDATDNDGTTPLWQALNKLRPNGDLGISQSLIRKADINRQSNTGEYPLLWAIEKRPELRTVPGPRFGERQESVLSLLLKENALDVNVSCSEGRSALLLAAKSEDSGTVKKLLEKEELKVNICDKDSRSPLSWAAGNRLPSIVENLLNHPEIDTYSRDIHGRTPLMWSICSGQMENMKLLLGKNYQALNIPDTEGRTPLSWAAERGNLTTVKFLLNLAGIDKDKKDNAGRTPLSWAVGNQSRSSETRNAFTPPQENELIVESLMETDGIDNNSVDNNGRTPFSWAVTNADFSIVQYLVRSGCIAIDQPDGTGRTPLSWCAEHGQLGVVETLLSKDTVDANLKDFSGRTPLYWATRKGNVRVMDILMQKDVDTLKMMVSEQPEQPDRVKLLLDAGYDASKLDPDGRTALHYAVSTKSIESTMHLISFGRSSINWKDNAGVTPLSLAVTKSPVLAKILVEHGATTDGIQTSAWFHENKDSVNDIICLSKQGATQGFQYMTKHSLAEEFTKPLPSEHLRKRLFKVPEDGAEFFVQFLNVLDSRWSRLLSQAEKHIRKQIQFDEEAPDHAHQASEVLPTKKFIDGLQNDVLKLYQLGDVVEDHVTEARGFFEKYCLPHNEGKGKQLALDAVTRLESREFTRVSMIEARRSTAIATSMRRLTWMTFIFLPLMFASSLFGMNVNVLKDNPDWKWYILVVGATVILTICGWIGFERILV
ncbi:hypothetical protein FPRO06_13869 [Fusarium proliferatum]|nr:hypothetical protein FPRO06_13869 [Fusarium proliferatum]